MDDLTRALLAMGDSTVAFTPLDVLAVFGTSVVLTLFVAWTYRSTHRGVSYSQSFAHTLVTWVSPSRSSCSSSRQRGSRLHARGRAEHHPLPARGEGDTRHRLRLRVLAVGMACGTRSYLLAGFATVCMIGVIVLMHKLSLFRKVVRERILIVRIRADVPPEEAFGEVFRRHLDEQHLISVESVEDEQQQELIYSVVLQRRADPAQLLADLRAANGNQKVSLVIGQQELDL
jgi:hypothetical protein